VLAQSSQEQYGVKTVVPAFGESVEVE